jgi:hypothetical protein
MSIGFDEQEWAAFREALRVRYHCGQSQEALDSLTFRERASLARIAIWAVSKAIVRDGGITYLPACDLRPETSEETAERLGEPLQEQLPLTPDNIVPLFPDAVSAA